MEGVQKGSKKGCFGVQNPSKPTIYDCKPVFGKKSRQNPAEFLRKVPFWDFALFGSSGFGGVQKRGVFWDPSKRVKKGLFLTIYVTFWPFFEVVTGKLTFFEANRPPQLEFESIQGVKKASLVWEGGPKTAFLTKKTIFGGKNPIFDRFCGFWQKGG